MEKHMEE